ncbi:MAG TPA: hypothetical protein VF458_19015 [Ktedonobacteraceae bacterium]
MSKKQARNKPFRLEDYNETTEPLEALPEPLYLSPAFTEKPAGGAAPTMPATQPIFVPYTAEAQPAYPVYQPSPSVYPVLPPAPLKTYRGQPPGGASAREPARRRSRVPGVVKFCVLLMQLVLLARVVCLLFGVQNTALWLTLLFAAGDLFVLPARWLAENINLPILTGSPLLIYLEFLVAILAYGLCSRFLTLLLRAILD